jgi:hypothetical protein
MRKRKAHSSKGQNTSSMQRFHTLSVEVIQLRTTLQVASDPEALGIKPMGKNLP